MASTSGHMNLGMRIGFLVGWMCFALAFVAAAAESAYGQGFITSANDLLVAIAPGKWIAFKARHASVLFDNTVLPLMQLPGWLLAGIPAGFLLWSCRPHREVMDPELYDSLTTYDRLAELAEEEGALNDDPTFSQFDMNDYDEEHHREDVRTAKEYMENWQAAREDEQSERPLTPAEKMEKARENLSIPFDKLS